MNPSQTLTDLIKKIDFLRAEQTLQHQELAELIAQLESKLDFALAPVSASLKQENDDRH